MTTTPRRIERALISVSDKTGLIDFAKALAAQGVEIVSTGGTEGPRRAMQMVIYGHARQTPRVHWTFTHTPRSPAAPRKSGDAARNRRSQNEPELPL